jgi:hypothetical protein
MQGGFLFIKHINVGGHTLVGKLSGICGVSVGGVYDVQQRPI